MTYIYECKCEACQESYIGKLDLIYLFEDKNSKKEITADPAWLICADTGHYVSLIFTWKILGKADALKKRTSSFIKNCFYEHVGYYRKTIGQYECACFSRKT